MKVFKYTINVKYSDTVVLSLPLNARLLRVDEQQRAICLWALVDDQCDVFEDRTIRVAGTGHEIDGPGHVLQHINTFLVEGGRLVFHAFEVLKPRPTIEVLA